MCDDRSQYQLDAKSEQIFCLRHSASIYKTVGSIGSRVHKHHTCYWLLPLGVALAHNSRMRCQFIFVVVVHRIYLLTSLHLASRILICRIKTHQIIPDKISFNFCNPEHYVLVFVRACVYEFFLPNLLCVLDSVTTHSTALNHSYSDFNDVSDSQLNCFAFCLSHITSHTTVRRSQNIV